MDTTKAITHIGLCAGYGGIELGLGRVLPTLRSVALCEIEAFPIANLVAKMEAGLMDAAPVWTDLKTFPWESFRDRVDILTGGYPCQPFSAAGKRAGKDDPRHLWPWIADGIRILRPRICFLENVEGHISLGLSSVISDLEELGYQVSWGIFSAREVGAPHQRKRVFILAHDSSQGLEGLRECCELQGWEAPIGHSGSCGDSWPSRPGEPQHAWEPPRVVAYSKSERTNGGHELCGKEWGSRGTLQCESDGSSEPPRVVGAGLANTDRSRDSQSELQYTNLPTEPSGGNGEAVGNAEIPDVRKMFRDYRGESGEVSDTQQVESGGGDRGSLRDCDREIEPSLGRGPHGTPDWMDYAELCVSCDNRTDELRLLGNGVVPATTERAFRTLLKDLI